MTDTLRTYHLQTRADMLALSYYTLCRISDVTRYADPINAIEHLPHAWTLTTDALGNFVSIVESPRDPNPGEPEPKAPNAPKFDLFTAGASNPKTAKGDAQGWATIVLHLAPHSLAGRGNVCKWATAGCRAGCLNTAGRGGILAGTDEDIRAERTNGVQLARIRRTHEFFDDGATVFVYRLSRDIARHVAWCRKHGFRPAVRLNGTSDIPWERVAGELFAMFPQVRFYDYTKAPLTARPAGALPVNYSLTMSYSGENWLACEEALLAGRNVAAVFSTRKGQPLPATWRGFRVIDGDAHDLRFLDPRGVVVGLRAKGRARKDTSGFVVRV